MHRLPKMRPTNQIQGEQNCNDVDEQYADRKANIVKAPEGQKGNAARCEADHAQPETQGEGHPHESLYLIGSSLGDRNEEPTCQNASPDDVYERECTPNAIYGFRFLQVVPDPHVREPVSNHGEAVDGQLHD
mmetsp:Transcript_59685/g.174546  ORF Transcript_59685/g.174546 Transcript_59685/m.174546 type:complete len:132 (+) Transcript_59685:343-738(+)